MARVTNNYIWYPEDYPGRAFNLKYVTAFIEDASDMLVRFTFSPTSFIRFNKDAFVSAYNIFLAGTVIRFMSIDSAEAVGVPTVAQLAGVGDISSAEAFGTVTLGHKLSAVGDITSAEAVGVLTLGHTVNDIGTIASAENVPTDMIVSTAFAPPTWIEYDSTHTGTPTRALGTGPFANLSASFWMRTDDAANARVKIIAVSGEDPSPGGSNIHIRVESGSLEYFEQSDNMNYWEHIWSANLPTDGKWHHYGVKAGDCYIDGNAVTFTDSGSGEDPGSVHPSVSGTAFDVLATYIASGKHVDLADVRVFKVASDVQAQAEYNSTLLNDNANEIVGAWLMNEGSGSIIDDRSVKATDLSVVTGMTWKS